MDPITMAEISIATVITMNPSLNDYLINELKKKKKLVIYQLSRLHVGVFLKVNCKSIGRKRIPKTQFLEQIKSLSKEYLYTILGCKLENYHFMGSHDSSSDNKGQVFHGKGKQID